MRRLLVLLATCIAVLGVVVSAAQAALPPGQDPFYTYDGQKPLAQIPPGNPLTPLPQP